MSAGKTTQPIAIKFLVEIAFADVFVENVAKGGHDTLVSFYLPPRLDNGLDSMKLSASY